MRHRRRREFSRRSNPLTRLARQFGGFELEPETRRTVLALCWFLAGVIALLSLFGTAGRVGVWLQPRLFTWMGWGAYVIPAVVTLLAVTRLDPERFPLSRARYVGVVLTIVSALGLLHLPSPSFESLATADDGRGGGYVGWVIAYTLRAGIGSIPAAIALVVALAAGIILASNRTPRTFFVWVRERRLARARDRYAREQEDATLVEESDQEEIERDQEEEEPADEEEMEDVSDSESSHLPVFSLRTLDGVSGPGERNGASGTRGARSAPKLPPYEVPSLELLSGASTRPVSTDVKATQQSIQKTLGNFGIQVEMGEVSVGPTVTQYTLRPAEGIKLSKILALHNDLALALAAHPIRIEAPIPGKGLVGIEVPNKAVSIVRLREVLSSEAFAHSRAQLPFALGKDVAGEPLTADLASMPHLLVAGATGSGKSVFTNSLLVSLLYRHGPASLKFILVDPKRVELTLYNGIPHLLSPVITTAEKTINALRWAVAEMDRRYELLSAARKRDITSYNLSRRGGDTLPAIVVVIDELADIMARHAREVENAVIRLAQIARAVGIHLVLATQRPSVDVITGLIKANITSRMAFKVASAVDSRTILDAAGSEKLLGSGDMLFLATGHTKPRRIQGAYVSEEEVKSVVSFLIRTGAASYEASVTETRPELQAVTGETLGDNVDDELIAEATRVAIEAGRASTSLFQRRLRIGYGRAARIMDVLEERGIIGPPDGARPREVLASGGARERASDHVNEEAENKLSEDETEEGLKEGDEEGDASTGRFSRSTFPVSQDDDE